MTLTLTPTEQRVLGCLLEKEVTTPETYPLTLNALTTACNQKSSREPVMSLTDSEVLDTVNQLISKRLISEDEQFKRRVSKYAHRFCNTEFSDLQLSEQQKALICLLLLRGAQTAGELRTRAQRLCEFDDVKQVEATLVSMIEQQWVKPLPKEPGKREQRYQHLFGEEQGDDALSSQSQEPQIQVPQTSSSPETEQRLCDLEKKVAQLEQQIERLLAQ